MDKPNLLIISHVLPFPAASGQSLRVLYTLKAARENANVTFLTFAPLSRQKEIERKLKEYADEVIVFSSMTQSSILNKIYHKLRSKIYAFFTGLKESNYIIGEVEFSSSRIKNAIRDTKFDLVIFEYFHAYKSAAVFSEMGIPTVLDTHNILWQTYNEHVLKKNTASKLQNENNLEKYKAIEERAWDCFDHVIAINRSEYEYISKTLKRAKLMYMPMGIDMGIWPYSYAPASPPRLAYYGSLGSAHNRQNALECVEEIMPIIWEKYPEAEFWIIGSKPDEKIKSLTADTRIHVTGFVQDIASVLSGVSIVLCPWEGKYGFRSRLIEVMAVGVPVVTTHDAVDGMDMDDGTGIFLRDNFESMALTALELLNHPEKLQEQSKLAAEMVRNIYSYEATYQKGIKMLLEEVSVKK